MTSRERVRKLLERKPTDRIPNGIGGCETAGFHLIAYEKVKRILGVNYHRARLDTFMANAIVEPAVLEALKGDIILLASPDMCRARFWGSDSGKDWKEQTLWGRNYLVPEVEVFTTETDGTIWWGNNRKCPPGGIYFDEIPASAEFMDKQPSPDDYNPPDDIPDETLYSLEKEARFLYENTDYCINCGETICDLQLKPGGTMAWWIRMLEEPENAHEFLDKACEAGLSQLKLLDQAVGKYADILSIAHDFGDLRGITIGPELWRQIYKPHYKKLFTEWHKITKMRVNMHSCGAIGDIIGDLIECGVDILNPVQISAEGMDPALLKEKFGDRIIFYGGGFDCIQTPPDTAPDVVYETVKRNISILSKNGGYIFAGVHNIPGDVPEEHLCAMLKAYGDI